MTMVTPKNKKTTKIPDEFTSVSFEEETKQPEISRLSKNWTKYILSQLEDDEKDQDYPKTCGLGRLLEKEVAPIVSLQSEVLQCPSNSNNMTATVKSILRLSNGEVYEACADAQKGGLQPPYDQHVTAIAETRSEGRVYRRALKLKNVVTKEEMTNKEIDTGSTQISKGQITVIDNLCTNERLNINVHKLLKELFKEKYKENINSYSHDEGVIVSQKLMEYQKDINVIPSELRGYSPDWK